MSYVEKYYRAGHATDDNMVLAHLHAGNQSLRIHTHRLNTTRYFSTTKMTAGTLLSIM